MYEVFIEKLAKHKQILLLFYIFIHILKCNASRKHTPRQEDIQFQKKNYKNSILLPILIIQI